MNNGNESKQKLKRFADKYAFILLMLSLCVITISVFLLCVWLFGDVEVAFGAAFIIVMLLLSPILSADSTPTSSN